MSGPTTANSAIVKRDDEEKKVSFPARRKFSQRLETAYTTQCFSGGRSVNGKNGNGTAYGAAYTTRATYRACSSRNIFRQLIVEFKLRILFNPEE